jgi:hypothetical protein
VCGLNKVSAGKNSSEGARLCWNVENGLTESMNIELVNENKFRMKSERGSEKRKTEGALLFLSIFSKALERAIHFSFFFEIKCSGPLTRTIALG